MLITLTCCVNSFAQQYYFWVGNNEKFYLDLLPTKKYILVASPKDTTALRGRLAAADIRVDSFHVNDLNAYGTKLTSKDRECWAFVEGEVPLPNLTADEAVLYESAFFQIPDRESAVSPSAGLIPYKVEIALTDKLYVKLKRLEDFPILEQMAVENNVEIHGSNLFMPLWYILSCTKNSRGNALEIANKFHETNLFESAQPEFRGGYYPADLTGMYSPRKNEAIYISNDVLYLNTPVGETVSVYSVLGVLLCKVEKKNGEIQIPIKAINVKMLIVTGSSGWIEKVITR